MGAQGSRPSADTKSMSTSPKYDCPDSDFYLDCGCVVGMNHGDWDPDLTYTDDCSEGHDVDDAIEIAERDIRA